MDLWLKWTIVYLALAIISVFPVIWAALKKVKLNPGGASFDESSYFSESAKERLNQHFSRIHGALIFWKNTANKYRYFHNYCLFWTVPASFLIPILIQNIDSGQHAKLLVTIISIHSAVLLLLHKSLKIESNFKAFRHGESEFYDLYRRLLDRPESFGDSEESQLDSYFEQVEVIRKYVRNAETDNFPTLEEVAAKQTKDNPLLK